LSRGQFLLSALSLSATALVLGALAYRLGALLWQWWVPIVVIAGIAATDFASGLVHWAADTWGRDDLPIIGERLLAPFRIHHVNPDDFLERRFVEANGDVAVLAVPVVSGLHALPFDAAWGAPLAMFGLVFCGSSVMTNQVHQWAHMASPPRPIAVLQNCGLLLGRTEHAAHHQRPYDQHYCITTGWCNRPLEALAFFRRLEAAITRVTGVPPRQDDRRYEARFNRPSSPGLEGRRA
jgi:ubiquitin-conjugating enzyme E2 variant